MKNKFSEKSLGNLSECIWILQEIAHMAIEEVDITVYEGYRGEEDQNFYFEKGLSLVKFPASGHNKKPSLAFDAAPWNKDKKAIDWKDESAFNRMGDILKDCADKVFKKYKIKGAKFKWGGDFKTLKDKPFMGQRNHALVIGVPHSGHFFSKQGTPLSWGIFFPHSGHWHSPPGPMPLPPPAPLPIPD